MIPNPRTAHPYRDTDVIDARAPRFNQATVGSLSLVAVLAGWWPLLTLLAIQLGLGLRYGRRWCLPCVTYFELVQPRFGEGPIEDSRPPRFANQIGFWCPRRRRRSLTWSAWGSSGTRSGCWSQRWRCWRRPPACARAARCTAIRARLRGIRRRAIDRVELAELGEPRGGGPLDDLLIAFSHPLCTDCHAVANELAAGSDRWVSVDVRERPDLARKYGVALVPTIVRVAADGRVVHQVAG